MSGGHLNPAITLAFAVRRGFAWFKVLPYMPLQVLGAFIGAALVLLVYHDAISAFDAASKGPKVNGHTLATFSIFATFPSPYFQGNMWGPLIDQIVGTMFLVLIVVAIIDLRNSAPLANMGPLVIGLAVAAIGISFGANAGYAINPARDLGPRLLAWVGGWGDLAMPGNLAGSFTAYIWVPIIGPLIGAVIGVLVYDLFIGDILHARSSQVLPGGAAHAPPPGPHTQEPETLQRKA